MTCRHVTRTRSEVAAMLAELDAEKQARAERMPTEQDAIDAMWQAYQRLRELGWREAMYMPASNAWFSTVEPGSTGIHETRRDDSRSYWTSDGGDLWPASPCLFRDRRDTDPRRTGPGVCLIVETVDDPPAAADA
jgi:hypothetical protein